MNSPFITIEGLDGSGKTTVIVGVIEYLNSRGIDQIVTTHEPGGTPIADMLCKLIKYGLDGEFIDNKAELLMIYAARCQLLERVIKPALLQGFWVIGDRYDLSSQAYQGGGRGVNKSLLKTLSNLVINDVLPNLILYLDIDPEVGLSRIKNSRKLDRIEHESLCFFNRVRSCYKELVASNKNVIMIDANQSLKNIVIVICDHLDHWFSSLYK